MADSELKVVLTAQIDGLKDGMNKATQSVKDAVSNMQHSFESAESAMTGGALNITNSLMSLAPAAIAAAGAFAGFEIAKNTLEAFVEMGLKVEHMSEMLGISTEKASMLTGTLKVLGMSTDEYAGIMVKLERQIHKSPDDFEALTGVTVRNGAAFRNVTDVLDDVIKKMQEFKPGADQMLFAMDALGPRGAQAAFELIHMKEAAEIATPIMQQLGLEMGENATVAARNLEMNMNALGLVWDGMKVKIGEALLPAMQGLVQALIGLVPVVKWVIDIFKLALTIFNEWGAEFMMLAQAIIGTLNAIWAAFQGIGQAMLKAAHGDFAGAWQAIKTGGVNAYAELNKAGLAMVNTAKNSIKEINALWSVIPMGGTGAPKGTKTYTPQEKGTKGAAVKADPSMMSDWRNALEQMKVDENAFFGFSVDRERAYWTEKLAIVNTNEAAYVATHKKHSADYLGVEHELFQLSTKEAKDGLTAKLDAIRLEQEQEKTSWTQRLALEDQKIALLTEKAATGGAEINQKLREALLQREQMTQAAAKADIDAQSKVLQNQISMIDMAAKAKEKETDVKYQLGQISATEQINLDKQTENERYASEQALLEKLKVLWAQYPAEYQKILNQMDKAQQTHANTIQEDELKLKQEIKKTWDSIMSPIKSALDTSIQGIIQGTTTLSTAMANLAQSILMSFVNFLIQRGMKWVEELAFEAVTGKATQTTAAVSTIMSNAAVAASGAMAAIAMIPYVGPALAPAVAAETYAATMAWVPVAAAAGGWDIPSGINPVTQLHQNEMVLPADIAGGVRNMVNQGGGQGGQGTVVIQAWDSADVKSFLKKNGNAVFDSLRGPSRNFRTGMWTRQPGRP